MSSRSTCGLAFLALTACGATDQPAGPGGAPPPPQSPETCTGTASEGSLLSADQAPYTLVDLGTLGGDQSTASDINDDGWIVGVSDLAATADGLTHAFLWTPARGITDLGTAPDALDSSASGINNNRQVVGWVGDRSTGTRRAALWTLDANGTVLTMTAFGPTVSAATDINDRGQIVGYIGTPARFTSDRASATLWTIQTDGSIETTDLGVLGGSAGFEARGGSAEWSVASAINEAGQAVGQSVLGTNACSVVWTADGDIGPVGTGMEGSALGINDMGEIVGRATPDVSSQTGAAYLWSPERGIVSLGGGIAEAAAINNRGQVVGKAQTAGMAGLPGFEDAFVWTVETGLQNLDPPNEFFSRAASINTDGLIVGSTDATRTATLWVPQ